MNECRFYPCKKSEQFVAHLNLIKNFDKKIAKRSETKRRKRIFSPTKIIPTGF